MDLGVMVMKGYSIFPKSSGLKPHHWMQFSVRLRRLLKPLKRYGRCILHLQLTGRIQSMYSKNFPPSHYNAQSSLNPYTHCNTNFSITQLMCLENIKTSHHIVHKTATKVNNSFIAMLKFQNQYLNLIKAMGFNQGLMQWDLIRDY